MDFSIDVPAHLRNDNYSRREQWRRILWTVARPLFRFSPRPCWEWRNTLLRLFGARVGAGSRLYPSVDVFFPWQLDIGESVLIGPGACLYNLGHLRIGDHVVISQRAHLCAASHDYRAPNLPLTRASIEISDHVWIAAEAFIGPGVEIGGQTVIGARAVVVKSFQGNGVLAGNPARCVKPFGEAEATESSVTNHPREP